MKSPQWIFIFWLMVLTVLITGSGYLLFNFIIPEHNFSGFYIIPVFFFLVTSVVHLYLLKVSSKEVRKFTPRFIGATGLKMLLFFGVMIIWLLINKQHAIEFLLSFLVIYIVYTLFEVISVLKYLKNRK